MKLLHQFVVSVCVLAFAAQPANALFSKAPLQVPLSELLDHARLHLTENPNDSDAFYRLARIRYLAFTYGLDSIHVPGTLHELKTVPYIWTEDEETWKESTERARIAEAKRLALSELGIAQEALLQREQREAFDLASERHLKTLRLRGWIPVQFEPRIRIAHAEAALRAFNEAIRLNRNVPLFHMGRVSLLKQFRDWSEVAKPAEVPRSLAGITDHDLMSGFWDAYSTAREGLNNKAKTPVEYSRAEVCFEASVGYAQLAQSHINELSDEERSRFVKLEDGLKLAESISGINRNRLITPIIFSLESVKQIDELLDPECVVQFDLRGFGPKQSWTWVKPDTGFLVWDPERSGVIDSGQQMFGSYTWQIFWRDGYEAMSVLDADGNGILEEAELDRLSVWFDRDGNGVSSPGEVVPVKSIGIAGLRTQATSKGANHVSNPNGLILQSGQELPTWDWLTSPVQSGIANPKP